MLQFPIWKKLLLKETLKYIILFLAGLYLVYVVIDLSTQSGRLVAYSHCTIFDLLFFYLQHFIIRLSLLLPLSLLLAMIKVLCSMNLHNELTALRMAGISLIDLTKPFFFIALVFTTINMINEQFLQPQAHLYVDTFHQVHLKKRTNKDSPHLAVSILKNGSKFIYQKDSQKTHLLQDVFWIKSKKEIWHIKKIDLSLKKPKGYFIDVLEKEKNKGFIKTRSFDSFFFKNLHLQKDTQAIAFEKRSLFSLFKSSFAKISSSDEKFGSLSNLLFKIQIALFPLILVIAILPFCIRKNASIFFLSCLSLFGLIAFYTFMETTVILGENQVLSPYIAITCPFFLFSLVWILFFFKKTTT